jgi:3-mercaptopyruvate sulfurtransferase SseA
MRKLAVLASLMLVASAGAQYKSSPTPPAPAPAPQPVVMSPAPAPEPPIESAKRIERDAAIKMVDEKKAVFVDVRPKDAYDAGHIKGSLNIPLSDLITRVKELPTNKEIITYCA